MLGVGGSARHELLLAISGLRRCISARTSTIRGRMRD